MIIFSRQGCHLFVNQLKLSLEERTSGAKKDGVLNFIMVMRQSIKSLRPFSPKSLYQIYLPYSCWYLQTNKNPWAYIPLIFLHCKVPEGKFHNCQTQTHNLYNKNVIAISHKVRLGSVLFGSNPLAENNSG